MYRLYKINTTLILILMSSPAKAAKEFTKHAKI